MTTTNIQLFPSTLTVLTMMNTLQYMKKKLLQPLITTIMMKKATLTKTMSLFLLNGATTTSNPQ